VDGKKFAAISGISFEASFLVAQEVPSPCRSLDQSSLLCALNLTLPGVLAREKDRLVLTAATAVGNLPSHLPLPQPTISPSCAFCLLQFLLVSRLCLGWSCSWSWPGPALGPLHWPGNSEPRFSALLHTTGGDAVSACCSQQLYKLVANSNYRNHLMKQPASEQNNKVQREKWMY